MIHKKLSFMLLTFFGLWLVSGDLTSAQLLPNLRDKLPDSTIDGTTDGDTSSDDDDDDMGTSNLRNTIKTGKGGLLTRDPKIRKSLGRLLKQAREDGKIRVIIQYNQTPDESLF